jgi:hypothetical protein
MLRAIKDLQEHSRLWIDSECTQRPDYVKAAEAFIDEWLPGDEEIIAPLASELHDAYNAGRRTTKAPIEPEGTVTRSQMRDRVAKAREFERAQTIEECAQTLNIMQGDAMARGASEEALILNEAQGTIRGLCARTSEAPLSAPCPKGCGGGLTYACRGCGAGMDPRSNEAQPDIRSLSLEMASHIAAIDHSSSKVADYIAERLQRWCSGQAQPKGDE